MKYILNLFLIGMLLVATTGCEDFLDVNTDPNNPAPDVISIELALPSTQMEVAGQLGGSYAIVGGMWSQHWTQSNASSQFRNEDRYALTSSSSPYESAWVNLYSDALIDLKFVRDKAEEEGEWNSYLQATCLMAYTYQFLVDFYDQVPYFESLQATDIPNPKFDNGSDIYDDLIVKLDEALSKDFSAATVRHIDTDLMFGSMGMDGQIEAWKQFANTLKLKIYLRQTKARPNVASSGISGLLTENNFLSQAAALDVFSDEAGRSNPFYESTIRQLNTDGNLRASTTFMSWLLDNSDPRVDAYFRAGSGGHAGLRQGDFGALSTVVDPNTVDKTNPSPDTPFYYFSTDEINFMLAEAHLRYGGAGSAATYYANGVSAAFNRVGYDAAPFLSGAYAYPNGSFDENLKAIITQKWAASVERGYESFFDQNRTGIPAISPVTSDNGSYVPGELAYSIAGTTSGTFPRRLIFPFATTSVNSNAPADVPLTTPVWWAE